MVRIITQTKWQLIWRCDISVHSLINTSPFEGTLPSGVLIALPPEWIVLALKLMLPAYTYCWYQSKTRTRIDLLFTIYPNSTTILFPPMSSFCVSYFQAVCTFFSHYCYIWKTAHTSSTILPAYRKAATQFLLKCSARPSFLLECLYTLSRALIIYISLSTFGVLQILVNEIHTTTYSVKHTSNTCMSEFCFHLFS